MDYSWPGFSVLGLFQARILELGSHSLLEGIFLTQGSNPGLLHCRQIVYCLNQQGSPVSWHHIESSLICSSVGELINRWWYSYTRECYSALKRNELSSHENTQRNLKCILLGERRQSEKDYIPYDISEKEKQDKWKVVACSGGEGENEQVKHRAFLVQWNSFVVL